MRLTAPVRTSAWLNAASRHSACRRAARPRGVSGAGRGVGGRRGRWKRAGMRDQEGGRERKERRRGGRGGEEGEERRRRGGEKGRRGGGEESGGPRAWSTPAAWTRGGWASSLSSSTTGVSPSACPRLSLSACPRTGAAAGAAAGAARAGAGRRGHPEDLAGERGKVEACREVEEQLAPRRLQRSRVRLVRGEGRDVSC